jgi:hypothetical protein
MTPFDAVPLNELFLNVFNDINLGDICLSDTTRGKGSTADAVGLQAARTYDHESGESQKWFRFEPSISATLLLWNSFQRGHELWPRVRYRLADGCISSREISLGLLGIQHGH